MSLLVLSFLVLLSGERKRERERQRERQKEIEPERDRVVDYLPTMVLQGLNEKEYQKNNKKQ